MRYEIRPPHSITKDEVANIRVFDAVDSFEEKKSVEELITFCHRIIPRDPAPYNTHSVISH